MDKLSTLFVENIIIGGKVCTLLLYNRQYLQVPLDSWGAIFKIIFLYREKIDNWGKIQTKFGGTL